MRGREPVKNKSVKNSPLSKNKNKNEIKVVCKLHFFLSVVPGLPTLLYSAPPLNVMRVVR